MRRPTPVDPDSGDPIGDNLYPNLTSGCIPVGWSTCQYPLFPGDPWLYRHVDRSRAIRRSWRRLCGESFASLGASLDISTVRVRQIFQREDARAKRAAELAEAATPTRCSCRHAYGAFLNRSVASPTSHRPMSWPLITDQPCSFSGRPLTGRTGKTSAPGWQLGGFRSNGRGRSAKGVVLATIRPSNRT